jgi:hypothetical protein
LRVQNVSLWEKVKINQWQVAMSILTG